MGKGWKYDKKYEAAFYTHKKEEKQEKNDTKEED